MMRVGVVIDSACDLPTEYLKQHDIEVLPVNLQLGTEEFLDVRDERETINFYSRYASKGIHAQTAPPTTEQIISAIMERSATRFDRLLIVTTSSTRSKIYEHVTKAQLPLLNAVRQMRKKEQIKGSFFLRVYDSKTLFTGEAVLVSEIVRLLRNKSLNFDELCRQADVLSNVIHAYLVPRDLFFVRKRASQKGENSIGWLRYQAGTLLDIKPIIRAHQGETETLMTAQGFDNAVKKLLGVAVADIDKGLKINTIALSYAGDLSEMTKHPMIQEFCDYSISKGIEVLKSVMSTTAGVHVGPGALSLAYAV
jgi:DegV family protein with EDD domain